MTRTLGHLILKTVKNLSVLLTLAGTPCLLAKTGDEPESRFSLNRGFGMLIVDGWDQVVVLAVQPSGSAAQAGVQIGDVIVSFGGVSIRSVREIREISELLNEGDQVECVIERLGQSEDLLLEYGIASVDDAESTWSPDLDEMNSRKPLQRLEEVLAVPMDRQPGKHLQLDNTKMQEPMSPDTNAALPQVNQQQPTRSQLLELIRSQRQQIKLLQREIEQLKGELTRNQDPKTKRQF